MAKNRKQTRITAEVNGEPRRLLSVREKPNGGLNISISSAKFFTERAHLLDTGPPLRRVEIEEQKYSVHFGTTWPGISVHHTLLGKDGTRRDTYTNTLCAVNGTVEPIYAVTADDTRDFLVSFTPHSGDETKHIIVYAPDTLTLHFIVFIAPKTATDDMIFLSEKYNRHVVHFSEVSLIILTTFTFSASEGGGAVYHFGGKEPVFDGVKTYSEPKPPSAGLSPVEAQKFAEQYFNMLHNVYGKRVLAILEKEIPPQVLHFIKLNFDAGVHPDPLDLN